MCSLEDNKQKDLHASFLVSRLESYKNHFLNATKDFERALFKKYLVIITFIPFLYLLPKLIEILKLYYSGLIIVILILFSIPIFFYQNHKSGVIRNKFNNTKKRADKYIIQSGEYLEKADLDYSNKEKLDEALIDLKPISSNF